MRGQSLGWTLWVLLLGACGSTADGPADAVDAPFATGKVDGLGPDGVRAVLALVNDPAIDAAILDGDVGLHPSAAQNIVEHRDGPDGTPATEDDDRFDDLSELDGIPYVGPVALERLTEYALANGYGGEIEPIEVLFAPSPVEDSHLREIAEAIASAQTSVDIAIYSYSDTDIVEALLQAAERGVQIRFLSEQANEDRRLDPAAQMDSKSGQLEAAGIDCRYINKINHHKIAIIDGPRDDLQAASTSTVITGSGNWTYGAATRFDENTLVLRGNEELALRFQREFNRLWDHSRDFSTNPEIAFEQSSLAIDDTLIVDDPDQDAIFTSANFDVAAGGTTFRVSDRTVASDALVAAIEGATASIHIASGHMRLRPVAEALVAKAQAEPDLDIRVYLDAQEYVSEGGHWGQIHELNACLDEAGDDSEAQQDCLAKNFRFGYMLSELGIDVRYKFYAYRWHFAYADQMHHKYMLVDGDELWTGSFNLSNNAERNTMENIVVLRGPVHAEIIASFEDNFEALWTTRSDHLEVLRNEIATATVIPLVFEPVALTWADATDLLALILEHCPAADSDDYREHPVANQTCPRA